jgi:hypothetical protein
VEHTRTSAPSARIALTVTGFRADRRHLPWWRRLLSRLRYGGARAKTPSEASHLVDVTRRVRGG